MKKRFVLFVTIILHFYHTRLNSNQLVRRNNKMKYKCRFVSTTYTLLIAFNTYDVKQIKLYLSEL